MTPSAKTDCRGGNKVNRYDPNRSNNKRRV